MGGTSTFTIEQGKIDQDTLRISDHNATLRVSIFKYRDKDTKQLVCIIPSLDISGYGENDAKVFEMIEFSLGDFSRFLLEMSHKKRFSFLNNLGWKQQSFKNKEFSKAFVDVDGNLQDLNAEDNKIERLTLVSA